MRTREDGTVRNIVVGAGGGVPVTDPLGHPSRTRYGVFLRPDAATCWNVVQVTTALRQQFGFVSAGAFPPHATLVGNLATTATPASLIDALDPVFADTRPFAVRNAGVAHAVGFHYDIDGAPSGAGRNGPLVEVARAVRAALLPLSIPVEDRLVTPLADAEFFGHIGLASHELSTDRSAADEVGEFIATLPIAPPPAGFEAGWYSLLRFDADWQGDWREGMTWRRVRSWHVA